MESTGQLVTSDILTKAAMLTNKFRIVGSKPDAVTRSRSTPKAIRLATNKLINAHKISRSNEHGKNKSRASVAREAFVCTRKKYRQVVRQQRVKDSIERYHKLDNIFSKPSSAYAYIRSCRNTKPRKIEQLTVGGKVYTGSSVCDGFFKSMTSLKQCDMKQLREDPSLTSEFMNYAETNQPIPSISLAKSS